MASLNINILGVFIHVEREQSIPRTHRDVWREADDSLNGYFLGYYFTICREPGVLFKVG